MGKLDGKIAVITGGDSGFGLAAAKRFVAQGARIFITGRRADDLGRAAREIGDKVTAFQGDVSVLAELDRLYEFVEHAAGHIDILFANAGGGEFSALGEITEEHFEKAFRTNVKGALFTVQKALPLMGAGGSIIITGSTTSIIGPPAFSVYSATKAAVRNFVRSWILDLRGQGIRVNILSPGATMTPGLTGLVPANQETDLIAGLVKDIPLGRVADPDEIAKVAYFWPQMIVRS